MAKKDDNKNIFSANSIIDKEKIVIPWSPSIDFATGGGIEEGSLVIIAGPPKVGKTSCCIHLAAQAQKLGYTIYYGNIEGRLSHRDLSSVSELDVSDDKFKIVGSTSSNIIYGEDYLRIFQKILTTEEKAFCFFDSFSQLCEKELNDDYKFDKNFRTTMSGRLSSFCKSISNVIPINGNICVGVTHLYANQSPTSRKATVEASGLKIQYQCNFKLRATHATPWIVNEKQIGQDINIICETSALGPPNSSTTVKLRYNEGIDEGAELLDQCITLGLVKQSGSWLQLGEEKKQGFDKMLAYIKDNSKLLDSLKVQIKERI